MERTHPHSTPGQRRRKTLHGYRFGPAAPSVNLPFPPSANLTAAELLAFLPHSLRSADVVYRLISNGGTRQVLHIMINAQRDLLVEWSANSCGSTLYQTMHDAGYEDWTVKIHNRWHDQRKKLWDESDLSVAGFCTPSQRNKDGAQASDIPFDSLAVDVKRMPVGDDALDLTRMVQHCVDKPHERWMYPRDYDALLKRLGGFMPVKKGHIDRAAFARWAGFIFRPYQDQQMGLARETQDESRLKLEPVRVVNSLVAEKTTSDRRQWKGQIPKLGQRQQLDPQVLLLGQGEMQKRPRSSRAPLQSHRTTDGTVMHSVHNNEHAQRNEQYIRAPIAYVTPVKPTVLYSDTAITRAFVSDGEADESNCFSPYAFGGPRHTAPFRPLYRLGQPNPLDTSGWAENLRWAYEQHACFARTYRKDLWNESPEHMNFIAKTRLDQEWVSEELLEQLANEQRKK